MSGKRCHKLDTEEKLEYSHDLSDSTSEDEIPGFSSITPYSLSLFKN